MSVLLRARRGAAAALLLFAATAWSEPADPPREPSPDVPGDGGVNRALGVGEPMAPEPFTLELRYLDAARRGDRRTLERCLERGVAVDTKDDLGRSALLLAARDAGSLELVVFLREKGADVDLPDLGGQTALSWSAAAGRLDLVRQLAAWGAATDRPDEDGRAPLFHAGLGDHREVVVFLLERGAAVNRADRFGDTLLMMACAKGYGDLATLLVQRGADPALRDQEGRTARDRAAPGTDACSKLGPR